MVDVKALKITRLTFILPDNFTGDYSDALRLVADYMEKRKGQDIKTPTDPAIQRNAMLEVLEGGGRLLAEMRMEKIPVPDRLITKKHIIRTGGIHLK